jgi:hypothetical protein
MRIILLVTTLVLESITSCKKEAIGSKPYALKDPRLVEEGHKKGELPMHRIWKAKYVDNYLPDSLVDYLGKTKQGC